MRGDNSPSDQGYDCSMSSVRQLGLCGTFMTPQAQPGVFTYTLLQDRTFFQEIRHKAEHRQESSSCGRDPVEIAYLEFENLGGPIVSDRRALVFPLRTRLTGWMCASSFGE